MLDKCLKNAGNWLWKKTITTSEQQYWDSPPSSSPPPSWPLKAYYSAKALTLRALLPSFAWLAVVSFAGVGLLLASIWLLGGAR